MLSINTNVSALAAQRYLVDAQKSVDKSSERLASGSRINWASDDAAGLTISEGLRAQISGNTIAIRNTQDAMSMMRTAEGGLKGATPILQRLRDLALEASNEALSADARTALADESTLLVQELTNIASTTQFNGINLLDGSAGTAGTLTFQVGANAGDQVSVNLTPANLTTVATALGSLDFSTVAAAQTSLGTIDTQAAAVTKANSTIGSYYNRFERTAKSLSVAVENLSAADSRIRDVDAAAETTNLAKAQILAQYSAAMLAQANSQPSTVLSLLLR